MRLDLVRCLVCSAALRRAEFQRSLMSLNADWTNQDAVLPDGDAELDHKDFPGFAVPHCACPVADL